LVFTGWIALFVTQATLIAAGQTSVHRKLGILGVILACSIVVLSIISTFRVFALGQERFFFANPHIEVVVFAILVVPAFVFRRNPDAHKRLVLLATISLIGAATVHLPFIGHLSQHAYLVVQDSFIAAGMAYDVVSRRRVHQTYLWGGLVIVFSQYVLWVNRL
jgi:Mn2+/Fe2+ NRAMP family transporter